MLNEDSWLSWAMRRAAFVIILLAGCLTGGAQIFEQRIWVYDGDTLRYNIARPPGSKKAPLLLFLHGAGQRGSDNVSQVSNVGLLMSTHAFQRFPCTILVPQCPTNDVWVKFPGFPHSLATTSEPTRPTALLLHLLDSLLKENTVDKNRVYVTGLSMGGEGTIDLLTRRPRMFAAAVPICSVSDTSRATSIAHVPLWFFHGDADKVNDVKYSRLMVEALKAKGGQPRYTEYEGVGHNSWTRAYAERGVLPWIFSRRRGRR